MISNPLAFALYLFPITAGHVMIPPLSYFIAGTSELEGSAAKLFELIYALGPRELLSPKFVTSLALDYDPTDRDQKITTQHFTHMFVHGTYGHMMNNLVS